jgi:hypothetical protein
VSQCLRPLRGTITNADTSWVRDTRGPFVGRAFLVGLVASTLAFTMMNAAAFPVGAATAGDRAKPSPGHLVVGRSVTLPPTLFEANPLGSRSGILLTWSQSMDVAKAMWPLWETALVDSDTRALTQLISPGPVLDGTLDTCADPDGKCVEESKPRPIESLTTIVPVQNHYPIYFLAEVRTTADATGLNGLDTWEPWIELQILTKASASSSWKISFDSGLDGPDGASPTLLPFDLVSASTLPQPTPGDINVRPNRTPPQPADQYLSLLGSYWQSFVDVGHAPDQSVFVTDGYTSGVGQQLAQFPQGSTYVGHAQQFEFSSSSKDQSWVFSASGGYPLVCGTIDETESDTTSPSSPMFQNSDESNYGTPLAPGYYSQITNKVAHDTCVLVVAGGLDAVGDNEYVIARTGTSVSAPQTAESPAGSSEGVSTISDLETVYGVLRDQLADYVTRLEACAKKEANSCSKTYALSASQQFARFSTSLVGLHFPSRLSGEVRTLSSSSVRASRLFSKFGSSRNPHLLAAGVINAITLFDQNYSQLIHDLSA